MGLGIAVRFLMAGIDVELVERNPVLRENAVFRATWGRYGLAHAVSTGAISTARALEAAAHLKVVDVPDAVLGSVDLVMEAIHEDREAKLATFRGLPDRVFHDRTVVATNTAALSVAELSTGAPDPRRFIGWHWAFPAQVARFAEIIPTVQTAPQVVEWTVRVAQRLGKAPTIVREGSRPGFGLNRIWYAMMDEARTIGAEGVATPDAIDRQYETSQNWPKGPFRVDREDADSVGSNPWPTLTLATLEATITATEFFPPRVGADA